MDFKNVTEILVRQRMDDILPTIDMCQCHKCYMDVLALTLNDLPARYVNTRFGGLMKKLEAADFQTNADIDTAITKAVAIVKSKPRHDIGKDTQ